MAKNEKKFDLSSAIKRSYPLTSNEHLDADQKILESRRQQLVVVVFDVGIENVFDDSVIY